MAFDSIPPDEFIEGTVEDTTPLDRFELGKKKYEEELKQANGSLLGITRAQNNLEALVGKEVANAIITQDLAEKEFSVTVNQLALKYANATNIALRFHSDPEFSSAADKLEMVVGSVRKNQLLQNLFTTENE